MHARLVTMCVRVRPIRVFKDGNDYPFRCSQLPNLLTLGGGGFNLADINAAE
jgi:hypothetical protein